MMDINSLTIGQARELVNMFAGHIQPSNQSTQNQGLCDMIGKKVIIRTYSAGNWFGLLTKKAGDEVILTNARRMWYWVAKASISLSACAHHGIYPGKSKIIAPVDQVWLQAIEILPCTAEAICSLEGAPHVEAE